MQTVATDKLLRGLDTFSAPIMLCDMAARGWTILHANEAWVKRLGGRPARLAMLLLLRSLLTCLCDCCEGQATEQLASCVRAWQGPRGQWVL